MKNNNVWRVVLGVFIPLALLAQGENWVYRYHGPGNGRDEAYSIAFGLDGNIYSSGSSRGLGSYDDFTVISHTPSGSERWVYTYNGPGNSHDDAYAIAYGLDNNIYAAGVSYDNSTDDDFTVISHTASGSERWVYRYNGSGNDMDGAVAIVYGSDDNIYAAGGSSDAINLVDFTIVSLTPTGAERWVYTYNGPGNSLDMAYSIVYGLDGNIYAAGFSGGNGTGEDFTVISLTTTGTERWVYRYNGSADATDYGYSLVYGPDGNLYITGWCHESATQEDFTIVSLTPSGGERWIYQYNGSANLEDYGRSIVYGSDGNVYAVGWSRESATWHDFTIISLTSAGTERWVYTYNGSGNSSDCANSVVYGLDNYIYAAGLVYGSGTSDDFAVISLTPSGGERWIYTYNVMGNGDDMAYSLVYGSDGNVYAVGWSEDTMTYADFTVISLDPVTGVTEEGTSLIKTCNDPQTIICGQLHMPRNKNCKVFDITGRVVLHDKIKPGIYFIEVDGQIIQKVIKIK